ncbi:unnamed protein product [Adineta ricciae]|uniref:Uncharacterized protein n=1 Tax=Adineta ricciae TaxID=249248 RepID=A0A816BMC9_ADIRI|nr:unnamed protein product [Adineta ricciae]
MADNTRMPYSVDFSNSDTILFDSHQFWVDSNSNSNQFHSIPILELESDCLESGLVHADCLIVPLNETDLCPPVLVKELTHFGPLIYNATTTQFSPYINVSTMFKAIMIEEWNSSTSYKSFYQSCAPIYCTYSQKMGTKCFLE